MNKPIIGIAPGFIIEKSQTAVHRDYADAIEAAGGLPIILPTIALKPYLIKMANVCDGILITGSNSDVDPRKYRQQSLSDSVELNPVREETDWMLLDAVFRKKKPLFGICYGHQEINVYLGGTLYQDIAQQVPHAVQHRQSPPYHLPVHAVRIAENSFLHKITGKLEIEVNSRHHQAVDRLAPALIPVASSPDGLNEAFILNNKHHVVISVQWHPESMWKTDSNAFNLFRYFIKKCFILSKRKKNI